MAYEKTIESLYDEEEDDGTESNENHLIPGEFIDPELSDIEDIDDEALLFDNPQIFSGDRHDNEFQNEEEEFENNKDNKQSLDETSIINDLLKDKGIVDPKSIQYENDNGDIEEVDFYSLPYEDQLAILKTDVADSPAYSDHELEVVDFLRTQNATFDDVIAFAQRQAVEDYIRDSTGESFVVDDYDDNTLYLMDLKIKYEDFTDEELQYELDKELQHEDLFKKKVERIRQEYVQLEIEQKESQTQANLDKEATELETLTTNIVNAAVSTVDIGGLELDDNDKNIIISTVLEKDINGISKFVKNLEDPETLFRLAWFAEKGEEAFSIIHEYYKKQIDEVRKTSYAKGKGDAKPKAAGTTPNKDGKQSYRRQEPTNSKTSKTIDDLYDE